jgi:hypothetical protein
MLNNKNKFETTSVNPPRNSPNLCSTQEKKQCDLQTEAFLFDDGHVEIISQYFHVPPSIAVCYQQTYAQFLNAEYASLPQYAFVFCGEVDA